MIKPMGIRLPEEVLTKIEEISKEEMLDKSTVIRKLVMKGYISFVKEKAAEKYSKGEITFSEAAHKANLNLWEMEKYLVANGFKSNYSIDDFDEEMKLLEKSK